jgi:hypothetical protein
MRYLAETSSSGVGGMQSTVGVENEDVALKEGNGWDIPKKSSPDRNKNRYVKEGEGDHSSRSTDLPMWEG